MNMTWEEAIAVLENRLSHCRYVYDTAQFPDITYPGAKREIDAIKIALSALRPITREQVERMFPGCDFCNMADFGEFGFEITKHYAKICCALGSWRFPQNEQFLFCPKCGKPLTYEAVDMVMERLEALKDA